MRARRVAQKSSTMLLPEAWSWNLLGSQGASPEPHRMPPPSRGAHFAESQAKPPHMLSTCVLWGFQGASPEPHRRPPAIARMPFPSFPNKTTTHATYIYIYILAYIYIYIYVNGVLEGPHQSSTGSQILLTSPFHSLPNETTTNKTYIYIYYWYARASACLYICLHAFELNCGFDRDYNLGSKIRPERDCQTRRTKRPQTWYLFVTCWTSWEVARRQFRKISSETATHAIYILVRSWSPGRESKENRKGAKREPKGTKKTPKGANREPKGSQKGAKGSQLVKKHRNIKPHGSQREPKDAKGNQREPTGIQKGTKR